MQPFRRRLKIVLTSKLLRKQFVFGESYKDDALNISVNCYKYMSSLKDTCTIKITNLTYNEITQIIDGKFYDVEIWCGYENTGLNQIFNGGIYHISNERNDVKTNTVILLCASKLVAEFGQKRLNLTLTSSINLYTAMKYLSKKSGIRNASISEQLKKIKLNEPLAVNKTSFPNWLDEQCTQNENLIVNSDSIESQTFSIFDANRSNLRVWNLSKESLQVTGGFPQLGSEGLSLTVLPTTNYMCGDLIKIDNSLIDISASSKSEADKNNALYLNHGDNGKGEYMIFSMQYILQTRGGSFTLSLKCRNRDRIANYTGVK